MNATFLVTLNVESEDSLDGVAEAITDLLSDDLAVVEVKPWSRPSQEQSVGIANIFNNPPNAL